MKLLPLLFIIPVLISLVIIGQGMYIKSIQAEIDGDEDGKIVHYVGRVTLLAVAGLVLAAGLLIVLRYFIL